ncbi:MAG: ABC transporter ATP-binding protein [Acidimicrobiales bacterium]
MTATFLEVSGVSKSYGGVQALAGCSLRVRRGEVAGLIGPNGSGKTTLFNVITGYERVRQGTVSYEDRRITNSRPDKIFKLGIARTFQLDRVFGQLTALENVLVATQSGTGWIRSMMQTKGSAAQRQRAMDALEFMGLGALANLPAGKLSYGQRRLLEIAFVLVTEPRVILLDEPTAGINARLVDQLAGKIVELNRLGTTFLVVEHNMAFVMDLCTSVTVLDRGCHLVSGEPEVVRSDPRVLDAYLGGGKEPR